MNEFKGTPGPWALDESRHEGSINRLEPFRHIGMVSAYRADSTDAEENRANALLIATAPEMMDLLNDISNWLVCAPICTAEDMAQNFGAYQQEIDRLLNKALGK